MLLLLLLGRLSLLLHLVLLIVEIYRLELLFLFSGGVVVFVILETGSIRAR
jgi:hypothetical protein